MSLVHNNPENQALFPQFWTMLKTRTSLSLFQDVIWGREEKQQQRVCVQRCETYTWHLRRDHFLYHFIRGGTWSSFSYEGPDLISGTTMVTTQAERSGQALQAGGNRCRFIKSHSHPSDRIWSVPSLNTHDSSSKPSREVSPVCH